MLLLHINALVLLHKQSLLSLPIATVAESFSRVSSDTASAEPRAPFCGVSSARQQGVADQQTDLTCCSRFVQAQKRHPWVADSPVKQILAIFHCWKQPRCVLMLLPSVP